MNAALLGNYLIGLREGLEATLVVSILVAFLVKSGPAGAPAAGLVGVGAAVALSVGFGAVLDFVAADLLELRAAGAVRGDHLDRCAVVFVTWMIFWMRRFARSLAGDLRGQARAGDRPRRRRGGRDGVPGGGPEGPGDRAALLRRRPGRAPRPVRCWASLLGVLTAVVLGCCIYAGAVRVNLTVFFTWTGVAADPGRRRHPQVRRPRPAGGRRPAGPEHVRLRRLRRATTRSWYGGAARRHVQLHAHADRAGDGRLGRLRRPGARALPLARAAPAAPAAARRPAAATPVATAASTLAVDCPSRIDFTVASLLEAQLHARARRAGRRWPRRCSWPAAWADTTTPGRGPIAVTATDTGARSRGPRCRPARSTFTVTNSGIEGHRVLRVRRAATG